MGFRAIVSTQSYVRENPWPDWFVQDWGDAFHMDDGTLCVSKYELKNVYGFIEDYARALKECGWKFLQIERSGVYPHREKAMVVTLAWECGAAQVVKIHSWGIEPWVMEHGDGCDHDWDLVPAIARE